MFYTYNLPIEVASLPFVGTHGNAVVKVCPKLICLDGCNYVGKTTTIGKLKQYLESKGNKVLCLKQPFPQNVEYIKQQLEVHRSVLSKGEASGSYSNTDIAQLFRYDRRQLQIELDKDEAIEADIILLDRGEMSTLVCQQNHYRFTGSYSVQPGLTLNLTISKRELLARFNSRPSRGALDPTEIELSLRHSEFRSKTRALNQSFSKHGLTQQFHTVNNILNLVIDEIEFYVNLYRVGLGFSKDTGKGVGYPELTIKL